MLHEVLRPPKVHVTPFPVTHKKDTLLTLVSFLLLLLLLPPSPPPPLSSGALKRFNLFRCYQVAVMVREVVRPPEVHVTPIPHNGAGRNPKQTKCSSSSSSAVAAPIRWYRCHGKLQVES